MLIPMKRHRGLGQSAKDTLTLLSLISTHLSGRKSIEAFDYKVVIRDVDGNQSISFEPAYAWLYKSNTKRKESDKQSVLEHIFKLHYPRTSLQLSEGSSVTVSGRKYVPGLYRYCKMDNQSPKRWHRDTEEA